MEELKEIVTKTKYLRVNIFLKISKCIKLIVDIHPIYTYIYKTHLFQLSSEGKIPPSLRVQSIVGS